MRYLSRSSALLLLLCALKATAAELTWPLMCPDGSPDNCLVHIGYPDINGDNRAANCEAPIYRGHSGTDLIPHPVAVAEGVKVLAAADGEVIFMNDVLYDACPADHEDCRPGNRRLIRPGYEGGYTYCSGPGRYCSEAETRCFWCFSGNFVVLRHDGTDGVFATAYLHLRQDSVPLAPGQQVKAGDMLGMVGSSGNSQQPHLHFEVWQGGLYKPVDPWGGDCGDHSLWKKDA